MGWVASLFSNRQDWLQSTTSVIAPSYARHYAGHLRDPYLSPAFATNDDHWRRLEKAGVIVHVDVGTDEVLFDEVTALAKNMKDSGLNVQFREVSFSFVFRVLTTAPWGNALRVRL